MVTKQKAADDKTAKQGRVKVGRLKLGKETVKDLSGAETRRVKGGAGIAPDKTAPVPTSYCNGGTGVL
ncbi:MAG TPA: hypothetical protein VF546_24235 [Pyrinomonadaceae bacterium]